MLQALRFGLAIAPFGPGALVVDALVERTLSIQGDTHQSTQFAVDIFDAAFAFGKLCVFTALACFFGKEQGAAIALGSLAIGVSRGKGWVHTQAFVAQGHPIDIAHGFGVPMQVEGNGGNAFAMGHRLIAVPGIKSRISCDMNGKALQVSDRLDGEREKGGAIAFVKALSIFSQDDIAGDRISRGRATRSIAEEAFLFFFFGSIRLVLIAALFDAAFDNQGPLWGCGSH